jgi:hypothetical protein
VVRSDPAGEPGSAIIAPMRLSTTCVLILAATACGTSKQDGSAAPDQPAAASDPSAEPAAAPDPSAEPAAATEPVTDEPARPRRIIDCVSTRADDQLVEYACHLLATDDWAAVHVAVQRERDRLAGNAGDKAMSIYLYDQYEAVPDLGGTADPPPDQALVALYDNSLTGDWRFCFGGLRSDAGRKGDFRTCLLESDAGAAGDDPYRLD